MAKLAGKVAVVVGGGSGIGKGIARAFVQEGCSVVLASRNASRLQAAAEELQAEAIEGGKVLAVPTDAAVEEQVSALFKQTMDCFGKLDILVNSSGAFDGGPVDELSYETWLKVVDANLNGPFLCLREAFGIMKKAGGGRIINIGSISAQMPREYSAPYSTTKFAIQGLTHTAALEGRQYGIAVSALHPGNVAVERRVGTGNTAGWDESGEPMMATESIAEAALVMATLPPKVNMFEAIVLPLDQVYLGRG